MGIYDYHVDDVCIQFPWTANTEVQTQAVNLW